MREWIKREARMSALALAIALPMTIALLMVMWAMEQL